MNRGSLIRICFSLLPLMAAMGPLLSAWESLFAFRILVLLVVTIAITRLGAAPWLLGDQLFVFACASWLTAGTLLLVFVSGDLSAGLDEMTAIAVGCCMILASRPLQRIDVLLYDRLCLGWVLAYLVAAVVALNELVSGSHLSNYLSSASPDDRVRLLGLTASLFGNPNAYGVFIVMSVPWAYRIAGTCRGGSRVAAVLCLATSPALLISSGARICVVAWALTLLALVSSGRKRGRWLGFFLTAVCSLSLLVFWDRLPSAGGLLTRQGSGEIRLNLSLNALSFFWQSGGVGIGPGAFESNIANGAGPFPTFGETNAHNLWFEILAQYGFVPFLALAAWLTVVWRLAARSAQPATCRAAIAGLLLAGLADSSLLEASYLWTSLMTIAVSCRALEPAVAAQAAAKSSRVVYEDLSVSVPPT